MNTDNREIRNPWSIALLHLVPGVIVAAGYVLLLHVPLLWGYPKALVLGIAVLLFLVPTELGLLTLVAKREGGGYHLNGVLGMKTKLSFKAYVSYTLILFVVVGLLITVLKPVTDFIMNGMSQWIPNWYLLGDDLKLFSRDKLVVTLLVHLVALTLVGPIVEELYFRGFLLARMKRLGAFGVFVNTLLFSLYHFWSPWLVVTRLVAMFPLYYVAYKRDSYKLAIFVHCLCNFTDVVVIVMLLL